MHKQFIDAWCQAFEAKFSRRYEFQGGKDGAAVKRLIASRPAEQILEVAKRAWSLPKDWDCKQAVTIAGLASRWNQIAARINLRETNDPKEFEPHIFDEYGYR